MKRFEWNDDKNAQLQTERNISFEEVVFYLSQGLFLDIIESPNNQKHKGQKVYVLAVEDYAYYVPFVEDEEKIFLKTIMPSRKLTKTYLK